MIGKSIREINNEILGTAKGPYDLPYLGHKEASCNKIPTDYAGFLALRTDTSKRSPKPPVAVFILDGTTRYPAIQRESLSSLSGQAGSRKTTTTALFVAAALTVEPVQGTLIGNLPEERRRVLFIDTEQERYYTENFVHNIEQLIDPTFVKQNLYHYPLRGYNPVERFEFIEDALAVHPPIGLLVIDNVAHLVHDFNSQIESRLALDRLSALTVKYGCGILMVIHDNPANANSAAKMKGHLGSMALEASSCAISVKVVPNDPTRSIVEPRKVRDKPFTPFAIYRDEDGLPVVDHEIELDHKTKTYKGPGRKETKNKLDSYGNGNHKEFLQQIFHNARVSEMDPESLKMGILAVYHPDICKKEALAAPAKLVKMGFLKDNGKKTTGLMYSLAERSTEDELPF